MNLLNLIQVVSYGGSYREVWDDSYKLKIVYEHQNRLRLLFRDGAWYPEKGVLPEFPSLARFCSESADASVAAKRFLASGQTARSFSALAPGGSSGPFFAAECLRILLDDFGLKLETVYPYIEPCLNGEPHDDEIEDLYLLQPRSGHLLCLLRDLRRNVPPVLYDIRLPEFRRPYGAVTAGAEIVLSFHAPPGAFIESVIELYGDSLYREIPMRRDDDGWTAEFTAPSEPAALWYRFRVKESVHPGSWWICPAPDGLHAWLRGSAEDGFRLTVSAPGFETPSWFRSAVLYQVFPDRFAFSDDGTAEKGIAYHRTLGQTPDLHQTWDEEVRWQARPFEKDYIPDDFFGGTLRGIMNKLSYLHDLGVTCIYLNPVVEARSNHRYDTSDYLKVDPILGTNDDFTALCDAAQKHGIRILCDGVFSHTGADSIYFNRDAHYPEPGACQTESSPYDSWYDFRHFPDDYRSWWGFQELPEVNELDPAWQRFVVTDDDSVVRQWLRRGASGWRLDVADELPDGVLELIRLSAKEEKPDSLILGEVWEDAVLKESYGSRRRYALGTALDSVMNYPFRSAVLDFLHGRIDAFAFSDFLTAQRLHYPAPLYFGLMNLLGSHDVERLRNALATPQNWKALTREEQLRLESALDDTDWSRADRLERLALTIQFSIPGVPSIYYGDELAMTGAGDPFNRRPLRQDTLSEKALSLHDYIRELSQQRRSHPAFKEGEAFFLAANQDVLLILRTEERERILTVVNRSEEERDYALWLPTCRAEGQIGPCTAIIRIL